MSNLIEHQLRILNPIGNLLTILQDGYFASLTYGLRENEPGVLEFTLPNDFDTSLLMIDGIIEVYRAYGNLGFNLEGDTAWFIRKIYKGKDENGVEVIFVRAYSALELMARRIVAYYAGTSYTEKVNPWDTIIHEIVDQNFGPGSSYIGASYGVDSDRNLEPWLTVETDLAMGASYCVSIPWQNVLAALQEIVLGVRSQGEYATFDVVYLGNGLFEFRIYIGARGIDHSADSALPVVVSEDRFNLLQPSIDFDWEAESNFIFAAGQGEEIDRIVKTAQDDARIGISPFNRREYFRDARQSEVPESIQSEAYTGLEENRPKRVFNGQIMQTEGCIYGVHWKWGDIVTAEYGGYSFDCHVDAITVTINPDGSESVVGYLRSEEDV